MMKIKKAVIITIVGMTIFQAVPVYSYAASVQNINEIYETYADDIKTKFRIHNGILQYRHWNCTKGIWVEPYWINY